LHRSTIYQKYFKIRKGALPTRKGLKLILLLCVQEKSMRSILSKKVFVTKVHGSVCFVQAVSALTILTILFLRTVSAFAYGDLIEFIKQTIVLPAVFFFNLILVTASRRLDIACLWI